MKRTRTMHLGGAVVAATLLAGLLGGCTAAPPAPSASQTTDQNESTMSPTTVTSAVTASDPRVTEVLTVKVTESGLARVMSLVVALSGDEPVSTETIVNIAVAAVENAKSDIDELKLMARPAADPSAILDLSAGAEGLPADVEWVWLSSSLQFIGPDAAAIGGSR